MDEDLLKRNTDCVYFLASPLTCKKGVDCEFRHSKIARLNPKDCWYWLSGNCLNPTCAFRHPPLDGHGGAPSSEPAPSSVSANKTIVPCYFYFNGFCNKGDRCSFLHDIEGGASTEKSPKTASAFNDTFALSSENKASAGNDIMPGPRMAHLNPSETALKETVDTRFQPKEDLNYFEQSAQRDVPQQSVSPQISVSGDEEATEIRSDSLPADGSVHSKSHSCTDQSSDEQADDLVQEEWWESSPGFDVLVDGKSENLGCEDDPECFLTLDGERRELNSHFLGYDFENPDDYVPVCPPDAELLYERDVYDSYDFLDNKHVLGNDGKFPGYAKETMSDAIYSRKRKLMPMELAVYDQDFLDVRDRLRRRRMTDCHSITGLSRRHEALRLFGRSREMPQRHGMGWRVHGRLASEVRNSTYGSLRENGASSSAGIQRVSLRHSQQYRPRKHHKERKLAKQKLPSSGVSKKRVPREKKSAQKSTTFTGPKTLAQIKEEKKKAEENRDHIGIVRHVRRTRVDFQGPKPLNEILKEKGKIADKREGNAGSN